VVSAMRMRRVGDLLVLLLAAIAAPLPSDAGAGSCAAGTGGWARNTRNILPDLLFIPKLTDPASCCSACVSHAASHGCQAWTSNASGCGLKHASWEKGGYPGSTAGTIDPAPGPPLPPNPTPGPPPPPPAPLPPAPPAPAGACPLTESGPVQVSHDGQIVENLRIFTTTKEPGTYGNGGFLNSPFENVHFTQTGSGQNKTKHKDDRNRGAFFHFPQASSSRATRTL
jgi:hypothetical protein